MVEFSGLFLLLDSNNLAVPLVLSLSVVAYLSTACIRSLFVSILPHSSTILLVFSYCSRPPCEGNYHTVTVGPAPTLVVLVHARGR